MTPDHEEIQLSPRVGRFLNWLCHRHDGVTTEAITLGDDEVFLVPKTRKLIAHETAHVFQRDLFRPPWWPKCLGQVFVANLRFWIAYAREERKMGYLANKYEVSARDLANRLYPND